MIQQQRPSWAVALLLLCLSPVSLGLMESPPAGTTQAKVPPSKTQQVRPKTKGLEPESLMMKNLDAIRAKVPQSAVVIHPAKNTPAQIHFGNPSGESHIVMENPGDGSLHIRHGAYSDAQFSKQGSFVIGGEMRKGYTGGRLVLHYNKNGGWSFEGSGDNLEISNDLSGSWRTCMRVTKDGAVAVTGNMTTGALRSNTEVDVDGNIHVDGKLSLEGVPQWSLVDIDDFSNGAVGWTKQLTSVCGTGNHVLGGHCNFAGGEVRKAYSGLPPHKFVRVKAVFHFIDKWQGETAFATIDDRFVWTDVHSTLNHVNGINLCGKTTEPETKVGIPVDLVIPHTADLLTIGFGSTLDRDPCEASWGVDSLVVYVR